MLWDTNARINGLVATDLETLVSEVLSPFPRNAGFADGLFVMTTATDHKNNLNRSVLKKDYARTLRVETIANSAGGTARDTHLVSPGQFGQKYFLTKLLLSNNPSQRPVFLLNPSFSISRWVILTLKIG